MKLSRLVVLVLLIQAGLLNAQSDYRPGYVIQHSGDTLHGYIDYRGDQLMTHTCSYKDAENTVKEYSPRDIVAFRFLESKYYISREVNNEFIFLEYLIKGEVNIYYQRDDKGNHYCLDKEGMKFSEIIYEEGVKKVDNKEMRYETTRHMGLLSIYLQDAPQLQSQIQSISKQSIKI